MANETKTSGAVSVVWDGSVANIVVHSGRSENKMTTGTYGELRDALEQVTEDRRCRVIVIKGEPIFSAGGDWESHLDRDAHGYRAHLRLLFDIAIAMRTSGIPVIAAVRGRCSGGMHQLHLLADFTIAAEDATFSQHGCHAGTFPAFWGTQMLPAVVGEKRAREIAMLSWEYDAQEALAMGLCNRVVPVDGLDAEVRRWCDRLIEASPRSLRYAKTSLNYGTDLRWPAAWHARDSVAEFAQTPDWKEAVEAHIAGRRPSWARDELGEREG